MHSHEIQAILVLQMITLLQGIESTKTLRKSLEFITDRLAIRQAMQGLTLDLNQDSTEGSTQDEVQQFWSLVEQS